PVANQVQSGFFTSRVISTGLLQVWPSSLLWLTQTVREPLLLPSTICASVSLPRLWVSSSQIVPVLRSRTGQGLPQVLGPSSQTTSVGSQALPPSRLRFKIRSMSPASLRPCLRPSQKASTVPRAETITEGIR